MFALVLSKTLDFNIDSYNLYSLPNSLFTKYFFKMLIEGESTPFKVSAVICLTSNSNKIPVFFIEKNQIQIIDKIRNQVPSALFPELESELTCPALVTALASRLDQAITIDNGVMHMMSLAEIPMIVLFGPTNSEKFAPKNNYVKILDSKKIHNTSNIDSISVEEVYDLI